MGVRAQVGSIAALDGVRGVAVLWVVAFHYCALRGPAGDPWVAALASAPLVDAVLRNGYLGVDLFFLISGFLLTLPWLLREGTAPAPSARAFYARRLRRIVPAYYLQLALLFAVVLPLLQGGDYWRRDLYVFAWNGVAHGAFIHNTSPLTSGSMAVNGALWTLAVEAQFYLLLPLLAPAFARRPLAATAAAFAAAILWQDSARHDLRPVIAAYQQLGAHWGWSEDVIRRLLLTQMPSYLAHFALGALLGRAWLRRRERAAEPRHAAALVAAGLAAAAGLVAALRPGPAPWGEHTWLLTTLALGTLLFAAACGRGRVASTLLARGPLAFAGRVSYSAYLYHLPLLLLAMRFWEMPPATFLPAYLAALAGVAWASWRFVEQPFLRRGG